MITSIVVPSSSEIVNIICSSLIYVLIFIAIETVIFYMFITERIKSKAKYLAPNYANFLKNMKAEDKADEQAYINQQNTTFITNLYIILGSLLFTIVAIILIAIFILKIKVSFAYMGIIITLSFVYILIAVIVLLYAYYDKLQQNPKALDASFYSSYLNSILV